MSKIVLTRGLPASGKSTWAKYIAKHNPDTVRVSRDDIRSQLYPGADYRDIDEDLVTEVETATARAALRNGKMVIVDDMHLQQRYINRWQKLGYPVDIVEFHADEATLLTRNINRDNRVPNHVIVDNYKKYTNKDGSLREVSLKPEEHIFRSLEKYSPNPNLPSAYMFDIDGTLAHMVPGGRSPYDYSRVQEDIVDNAVAHVLSVLEEGEHIILVSGREDACREETEEWLANNHIRYDELHMRKAKDMRADTIVKHEIFKEKIAPNYNVKGVFDDRPIVCEMWRSIGVKTFQVGDPDVRF